ncbi:MULTISPECIES: CRISPR-associated endonuclease Cas2 [unclassified Micromonospora]|uniref:CRISPR-associated endonuclease Cas2 n=1 Tax=unclassified Micromonospora TaxID=2617518 RepID=UPI00098D01C2|nr:MULTISPECIES: CRISPR-associated endonuclease Cas2 [unclassified Micromonospora]MDI5938288.1 CRISPR-associated endonuclease Cas2 [Micromonospora sp. DH15]OON27129.1 CRISPR-associated endonuclease Cas2 [Micromonospora sp. Rc5]
MPSALVAYDISTDTTRARAAAMLQTWGDRIQRSVLICTLGTDDLHHLTERLRQLASPRTDAIHIASLCGTCWDDITMIGQATTQPDTLYWTVP